MPPATDLQQPRIQQALAADTFAALLGFVLEHAHDGQVTATATPTDQHSNAGGTVHGGYLSALADWATGCAALSASDVTALPPHASLTVQYVQAARVGQQLQCTATCTRLSRRTAASEAVITADGRLIAKALATHTVIALQPRGVDQSPLATSSSQGRR